MNIIRKLLIPFVPVYYFVTWLRNKLYDIGLKKSQTYDFPVLVVGNLSVGGTGKSPMIEYLIRLLKDKQIVATLSRGYKRTTKGFYVVTEHTAAIEVGDEPLQFKTKYKDITVAVDEDRRNGIQMLRSLDPVPSVVLLDDAYQHRKVKAGFYILLTAYYDLYCNDILLPTGNLREPIVGADRATIIIVTKCPRNIDIATQQKIRKQLQPKEYQSLLFSYIEYKNEILSVSGKKSIKMLKEKSFILVTGIANPKPLLDYYASLGLIFEHINFPDHHNFTTEEIRLLQKHKFIITTEKDYVRLASNFEENQLWYQPIEVGFVNDQTDFDAQVLRFVSDF